MTNEMVSEWLEQAFYLDSFEGLQNYSYSRHILAATPSSSFFLINEKTSFGHFLTNVFILTDFLLQKQKFEQKLLSNVKRIVPMCENVLYSFKDFP